MSPTTFSKDIMISRFLLIAALIIWSCDEKDLQWDLDRVARLPQVVTSSVSDIRNTEATAQGEVEWDGDAAITRRGICYATVAAPTIQNSVVESGNGEGPFQAVLSGLNRNTRYYFRAFATNSVGTAYGDVISFVTTDISAAIPQLSTNTVVSITRTDATSGGTISSNGGSPIVTKGVCYSTTANPTTANLTVNSGSGSATYSSAISGLSPGTTYYVRAFATNAVGTGYGNQLSFQTNSVALAVLTTNSTTAITQNSASSGGNITADGGSAITERGICYSTSVNPTTANTKVASGAGIGSFTVPMTGLTAGTTYYVRAYAINSTGTSYGNQVTFTTVSAIPPTVMTTGVNQITNSTATVNGNVTADGGSPVLSKGICYSTTANPTIAGLSATSTPGIGAYSCALTNLSPNTRYYARAYATNSAGTSYGGEINFLTDVQPSFLVGSNPCNNLTGVTSSFTYWSGSTYLTAPWTVSSQGYTGSCYYCYDPAIGRLSLGGYIQFSRTFTDSGYIRFRISNTWPGVYAPRRPNLIIDGVLTPADAFSNQPYTVIGTQNGWQQVQTPDIPSGNHTIRLDYPVSGQSYDFRIDEIEFWEY
jgi:hypothetical protein